MASSSSLKKVAALMLVLFAGHLLLAVAATPAAAAADGLVGRRSLLELSAAPPSQAPAPSPPSPLSFEDLINQCGQTCMLCFGQCYNELCIVVISNRAAFALCIQSCRIKCLKLGN